MNDNIYNSYPIKSKNNEEKTNPMYAAQLYEQFNKLTPFSQENSYKPNNDNKLNSNSLSKKIPNVNSPHFR